MKLLLHVCCGPCSVYPIEVLKEQGYDIQGMFYNPNIHPIDEYNSRIDSAKLHFYNSNLPIDIIDEFDQEQFLKKVSPSEDRCLECYSIRLDRIAKETAEKGFELFTTTLLVSPYQKHQAIIDIAEKAAQKYKVKFLYIDFRPGFREGQKKAREEGLYMQKYCGCILSKLHS